jgi:hypothetical protein
MDEQQREWLKSFENKTESEIKALSAPPGLSTASLMMWCRVREAALDRFQPLSEEETLFTEEKRACEATLTALENDTSQMEACAGVLPSQPPLEIPKGNAADLLEQQIGTCAALIGNIANYVAHNDTHADVCLPFMDRIASLLSSSATAARVVGQLRGIASETKQTFVKKVEGAREGGVPQT